MNPKIEYSKKYYIDVLKPKNKVKNINISVSKSLIIIEVKKFIVEI